jgi:hypothetical protein
MKRKPRRTLGQLALALAQEPTMRWPAQTQSALVAALADLLIGAHANEQQANPLLEHHHDEPEDHR